jgi:hypothetical protein
MKKLIILILFLVCSSCVSTRINVDREIAKAEQKKKDKENLPIIVAFILVAYFGGKFMTNDFQ